MKLKTLEQNFCSFLDESWKLSEIAPFPLAYLRLLFLFKNELSDAELAVLWQRQKQLRGENFKDDGFDEFRKSIGNERDRYLENNTSSSRKAMLNSLLCCARHDAEENHFFYLTEPMFEFARIMKISSDELKKILELEFAEFRF